MPAPRAVVFDCDGLMFNTEDLFEMMGDELMARRDRSLPYEVRAKMIGRRAPEAFGILIEELKLTDTIPELMTEAEHLFKDYLEAHLEPMPGLFELLDHLEDADVPKAVGTSSPRDYLDSLLDRFEMTDRFLFTLTAEDVTHGKPHPEVYRAAATEFDLTPDLIVVLEDSPAGVRSAAEAGTIAVAIPTRHTESGDFSPATLMIDSLSDPKLYALLAGEPLP